MTSPFEDSAPGELRAMTPEEFRVAAYAHVDWIANYFAHVRDYPVASKLQPGELIAALPGQAPESGEPIERILEDFDSTIFPSLTLWNHPRFFPWFSVSSTPPSILADLMISAMNVNAMLWKSSPGATELEQVTLSWLRQWLGLPQEWFGIIYDTASVGVMQALGAAREWIDPASRTSGMTGGLTIYVSEQSHNSAEKSAITLGFGQENVRRIPVDTEFRMRVDLLDDAIRNDLKAGKRPCCIVASIGATPASSIDPVPAIADLAERYQIWLHVDAAYAGAAAVVPEMRPLFAGVERADSIILNPHKWLYVSIDCSVLYTRRPEIFRRASSLNASYLSIAEDERVVNYNDYGVQLGRRFRALKLWYVFRYYGREGIVQMLRESLRLARILKTLVEADQDFELSAPVPFSLVCFRYRSGDDAFNMRLLDEINTSDQAFLSQTRLNGQFVLRFAIGNFQTNERDVRQTWEFIRTTASRLAQAPAAIPSGD